MREAQIEGEMANSAPEDFYGEEPNKVETNEGAEFIQSGEERKKLCK